jgi:GAF domain-containing protein
VSREAVLIQTMVQLADTLADDFDPVNMLTVLCERCVEILDVAAVGVILMAQTGDLEGVASSNETMRGVEIVEVQTSEGPCPDCYRTGRPVVHVDLQEAATRWPRFAPAALAAGFRSVDALPMHVRGQTLGALNLYLTDERQIPDEDLVVAQALADVATRSIVTYRATTKVDVLNDQLQSVLDIRILIEQAKGMIAVSQAVDMAEAFSRLRGYARTRNLRLGDVAKDVMDRTVHPRSLKPLESAT